MEQLKIDIGKKGKMLYFKPNVPSFTRPKITRLEVVDGITYYISGEKVFLASLFDKVFGVKREAIKKKYYKGATIGKHI